MPVEVPYSDYREFGEVKFPIRIRQAAGGFPAVDFTVTDVQPNAAGGHPVPDAIRQATKPYARVTSEAVADGRVVRDGRQPPQRGDRDEGPRRSWWRPRSTTSGRPR